MLLQPCGWLAAYMGSALTSDIDVSFRNLGGTATQFAQVLPDVGTLSIRVKLTRASSSAGMIIQFFDYQVSAGRKRLYKGENELNRFINVYVNDEDIRFMENLDTPVKAGDEVSIVPAIAGG